MRGNSRQLIYLTDIDRGTFMELLRRTIIRHGWELHGYCLMDNHFHLLVQTAEPTISTGMCYIQFALREEVQQPARPPRPSLRATVPLGDRQGR